MRPTSFNTLIYQLGYSIGKKAKMAADLECTPEMHSHDLVPHFLVHVDEGLVSEDTSIGDENVNRSESVNTGFDDSITILCRADSSNSLSTDYTGSAPRRRMPQARIDHVPFLTSSTTFSAPSLVTSLTTTLAPSLPNIKA